MSSAVAHSSESIDGDLREEIQHLREENAELTQRVERIEAVLTGISGAAATIIRTPEPSGHATR